MLERICELTGASSARVVERLQSLWSGYGEILRVELDSAPEPTVIAKRISPPPAGQDRHPRGWNTERSRQRKLRSYEVETHWYDAWAERCTRAARVAHSFGSVEHDGERLLVLEDLDRSGFDQRRDDLSDRELDDCLRWLANFHATFLGERPDGLWQCGTYWHLDTRPDELATMTDTELRDAAPRLDAALKRAKFRTLVHGDAKVANFCFASIARDPAVAAVDFQYVGGGIGTQDVAYFLGSCLDSRQLDVSGDAAVDRYFEHLRIALSSVRTEVDAEALEREWREYYPIAWADFIRWLSGWAPDGTHRKLNDYASRLTRVGMNRV